MLIAISMPQRMGVLMYETNMYEGMLAETVSMSGAHGDQVIAYFARPLGTGSFPGIVLIHYLLGWDEWYRWAAREFAYHGFLALVPNLYGREGQGPPEDIAADVQTAGGIADDQALGDIAGALQYLGALPYCNGKVGCFGTGSGGRLATLAASRIDRFHAAIDCWGEGVVMRKEELTVARPVAPIDHTKDLKCPLLGIFGEDGQAPSLAQVEQHEAELKRHRKTYEFYRYPNVGHDFIDFERPSYRRVQAVDAWQKMFEFLDKYLR
jgi:carboxymethylenebutenolidase